MLNTRSQLVRQLAELGLAAGDVVMVYASAAAVGHKAEWLCRDHRLQYGYRPGSPLAKLVVQVRAGF